MNVQQCQCSETADLCGKGCQTVGIEVSNRRASMGSVQPSTMFSEFSAVRLPICVGRDVSLLDSRLQTEEQASMSFRNRHSEPESHKLVFTSAPIFFVAKENSYPKKRKRRKFQNPASLDSHQATKPEFRRGAGGVRLVHFLFKNSQRLGIHKVFFVAQTKCQTNREVISLAAVKYMSK